MLQTSSRSLEVANTEYESGIMDGKVIQIVEYLDAIGFISRAESLINDTLSTLNQSIKTPADQVMSLFSPLNLKTQTKADIQTSITGIRQKISDMTGI